MSAKSAGGAAPQPSTDDPLTEFAHPRGTLAIVFAMALLFALGWAGMYFLMFLKRGGLHP